MDADVLTDIGGFGRGGNYVRRIERPSGSQIFSDLLRPPINLVEREGWKSNSLKVNAIFYQ